MAMLTLGAAVQPVGAGAPVVYETQCVSCHGTALQGTEFGPALTGAVFQKKWAAAPGALRDFISQKMPPANPGGLNAEEQTALAAFIAGANGWAAAGVAAPGAVGPPPSPGAQTFESMQQGEQELAEMSRIHDSNQPDALYLQAMASDQARIRSVAPVTDSMLQRPPDADWPMWRRATDSLGYSPLAQINRANVGRLSLAWSLALKPGTNSIAPLVHDGVMFVNVSGHVMALDAGNGNLIWEYAGNAGAGATIPASQPRSIALYGNSVFVPTLDGHLLALDMHSGRLLWEHAIFNAGEPLELTTGPIAVRSKVIQGVSGCETRDYRGGCYIVALDAATGAELWRFHTIARTGQPGGDSWNGAEVMDRYGASVWTPASYDPELNLLYFGTGQTYDISTLLRKNARRGESADALYTDCTLALDADTGKLVWYYQHLAGDVWDLDWAFEQTLISVPGLKGPRGAVLTGGKVGVFDALDAKTGQYLFSFDMGLQNLVSAIDPHTGAKTINPAARVSPDHPVHICPYVGGVRNWPSTAFDPDSGLMFIPMNESCMELSLSLDDPENQVQWSLMKRPDSDGKYGRLAAVDVSKKRIVWTDRYRAATSSAALATAGELVFEGTRDRYFRAHDSMSGTELWTARLDNVPNGFPISFEANGIQYVAIITGGGTPQDVMFSGITPEFQNATGARTIWVFKLSAP
jgi:alcohol dehydrogenase (cytochrome c)